MESAALVALAVVRNVPAIKSALNRSRAERDDVKRRMVME
jgi:hypothetical protein